jgi:hypothetical protein
MTKNTKPGRLTRALLEMADDMRRAGTMDAATHEKITLRHLGDRAAATAEPTTAPEQTGDRVSLMQLGHSSSRCSFRRMKGE